MPQFFAKILDRDIGVCLTVALDAESGRDALRILHSPTSPITVLTIDILENGSLRRIITRRDMLRAEFTHGTIETIAGPPPRRISSFDPWSETRREKRLLDQGRELIASWNCPRCKWKIQCVAQGYDDLQICPHCYLPHHLPADAATAAHRLMRLQQHRERQKELKHREAEERMLAVQREQEARIERQRVAAAAAAHRRHEEASHFYELAGLRTKPSGSLSESEIAKYELAKLLAAELASDIESAHNKRLLAEKAVAYGRPAAGGAGLASFLAGFDILGAGLAALAVAARTLSVDWQRLQLLQLQQKWFAILSNMDRETRELLTVAFLTQQPHFANLFLSESDPGADYEY